VIELLLRENYIVRGTVRDPKQTDKVEHLISIAKEIYQENWDQNLQFVKADLNEEGSFDECIKGAHGVMHVASSVVLTAKDVENDLVKPAVEGTLNVLKSCSKNNIKRVILTSSIAAIENGIPETEKPWKKYDESSNNTKASIDWKPYSYSKVKALEAAVKFHEEQKDKGETFRMVSIHPSAIYGPQQNKYVTSSNQIVQVLLSGEYPLYPPLWWPSCDVRDVARAHLLTLRSEKAEGRYIINNGHGWMSSYTTILKEKYPEAPIPSICMPVWVFSMASWFDKRIDKATVKEQTKEGVEIDGSKIERDLGFEYKYELKTSLLDTAESMVKHGCAEKGKKWVHKLKEKK